LNKYTLILLISLLSYSSIFCQSISKEIIYSFDSIPVDKRLLNTEKTEYEGKVLKVVIYDSLTHKIMSEFLRISDNSYFFRQYNNAGITTAEGKAQLEALPFYKEKVSLYNNNGETEGFKNYYFFKFVKAGAWYEQISDSLFRSGRYTNNKKEGKWFCGKTLGENNAIAITEEFYISGNLKKSENLNILQSFPESISKVIVGKWQVSSYPFLMDLDSLVLYRKVDSAHTTKFWHYLKFMTDRKCEIFIPGHHNSKKYVCSWYFNDANKTVIIDIPDIQTKFSITHLSKETLVGTYTESK